VRPGPCLFSDGLADEGWELLKGATLESAYASSVPGGFSHIGAGTDFADNTHMFARTVWRACSAMARTIQRAGSGAPGNSSAWPQASVRTPDFTFDYHQEDDADHYR